jgi:hypothetical protein
MNMTKIKKAMLDHAIIPKGLNPEYYEHRKKYYEKRGERN